ncbi:hypothetical protein ACHAWF_010113 [Thalassiosira exigua]
MSASADVSDGASASDDEFHDNVVVAVDEDSEMQDEPNEPRSVVKDGSDDIDGEDDLDDDDLDEDEPPPYLKFIKGKTSGYGRIILAVIVLGYSLWAFVANFQRALPLFVFELIVLGIAAVVFVADRYFPEQRDRFSHIMFVFFTETLGRNKIAAALCIVTMAVIIGVMVEDASNLRSALGILVFVLVSWGTSYKPKQVRWGPVLSGILRVSAVANAFNWAGEQIVILLNYTTAGSSFVYGYLVDTSLGGTPFLLANGSEYVLFPPFFFNVLSVLFFFCALVSVLDYLGAVAVVVKKLGVALAVVMGTSPAESFNTVANMFLGHTEAPMVIKSALPNITQSELHAIMTGGMASVSGAVLAAYISFGASASDLLAATVMSAPAALAISKLVYPETKRNTSDLFHFEMSKSGMCGDNSPVIIVSSINVLIGLLRYSLTHSRINCGPEEPNMIAAVVTGASQALMTVLGA